MTYQIEKLDPAVWKGTAIPVAWTSEYYYDIAVKRTDDGFAVPIEKKKFDQPYFHDPNAYEYPDRLYEDWWPGAESYGVIINGELKAAVEIAPEEWSKRFWMTELFVDEELRGQGVGRALIDLAKQITKEKNYRALLLEAQSGNVNAIEFYLHMGFQLTGFDTCCYSNQDIEKKEVRINLGWLNDEYAV